jgi:membrane associated rhomboid family serine protease
MYFFYWLPVGTDARVRGTPWATLALVILNVAAYGVALAIGGDPERLYAVAFKAANPTIHTALASLFLHTGILHLLGNMIFLSVFGPPVESRLGTVRYLIAYLACGWLSNLAQAAAILSFTPELAAVPIVGASGAVSGLMGLFAVRLYFARLRFVSATVLLLHGTVRPTRFTLPAPVGIGLWFLLSWVVLVAGAASETAVVAHLSGALFGALFGLVMGLAPEGRLERRLARGARYAERGEWYAALGEYESYLAARPRDPEALAHAARLLRVVHQDGKAGNRFIEAIQAWLRRGSLEAACDAYEEMRRLLGTAAVLPPAEQLRVARGFEELGRPSEASRAYEAYGRSYPERHAAALALLRSADIERRALNNPGRARYIYDELLQRQLPADIATMVRERKQVTERALERLNRGAA